MNGKRMLAIVLTMAAVAVLGATVMSAPDKYSLTTSSGIAFSDFRGYER